VCTVLDAFFGVEDPALANVDVMTDVSMAPTAFTRYTVAPSTVSRISKRSSRSKRKLERKAGSGRKGTVDEEEYLFKSVGKLVDRFKNTRGTFISPHFGLVKGNVDGIARRGSETLATFTAIQSGAPKGGSGTAKRYPES